MEERWAQVTVRLVSRLVLVMWEVRCGWRCYVKRGLVPSGVNVGSDMIVIGRCEVWKMGGRAVKLEMGA